MAAKKKFTRKATTAKGPQQSPAVPKVGDKDKKDFAVVGLGASAGGLDAFKKFLSNMPADSGMAFILIPHLDPTHESLMVELLAKQTSMPVTEAKDGTAVQPNHVYIIPPNKYVAVSDGVLKLSQPPKPRGLQTAIDFFLRSLAENHREKAIGIVLSGTGSHGTQGIREIKLAGGMVMVQDPASADYDQMPRSAIATGVADYILPPERMPDALIAYVQQPYLNHVEEPSPEEEKKWEELGRILATLKTRSKYDFRYYRKNMLLRRIQRRMGLCQVEEMADYVEYLRRNPEEVKALYKDLLIGVTGFFREPEAFEVVEQRVIPDLVERQLGEIPIRVWVPGCATGEEAYSLAILLLEGFAARKKTPSLQVFATDVDKESLEVARQGTYGESSAADLTPQRLQRFFIRIDDHHYQVNKPLREAVVYAAQNLISDAPFSKLDLISCRNLLIYLEPEVQEKVISLFHFALNPDGYLMLGPSESIGRASDRFEAISKKWRVYGRIGAVRRDLVDIPIVAAEERRLHVSRPVPAPALGYKELLQKMVLAEYAPAAVLINRNYEILNVLGPVVNYLEFPPGELSKDLMEMARQGLRTKIRAACHKALRDGRTVTDADARVKRNGSYIPCSITVKPLLEPKEVEGLLLVTLRDLPERPTALPAEPADESAAVRQLEFELSATREDLQRTIEELESSNEELKASNEEVMSMNEELQSTNEESETSKEELQSLNQELSTLNHQLQDKVEELDKAHNDMTNLLNSGDVATILLDTNLSIQRFTPAMAKLLGLIPGDVGRPISTFASKLIGDDLVEDARRVLVELTFAEREVVAEDGKCFLRRLLPCRTADNRIEGVVGTFLDISERMRQEEAVKKLNQELEGRVAERTNEIKLLAESVSHLGEGVLITDDELDWPGPRISFVNEAMCRISGYSAEELIGQSPRIMQGAETSREIRERIRRELSENRSFQGELINYRKDGTPYHAELFITPLFDAEGKRTNFVSVHRDVSERKRAEQALRESEEQLRAVVNTAVDAIITIDQRGIIQTVNPTTERMFGYAKEELVGQNVKMIMPPPYRQEHDGYIRRYLETREPHIIGIGREVMGQRKDGTTFPVDLAVSEIGSLKLFTGMIRDISSRKDLEREVVRIAADEQRRIGQELHDDIGQEMTGLALTADTLQTSLKRQSLPEAEMAANLVKGAQRTAEKIRNLSRGLIPAQVDAEGLIAALEGLAERFSELHGVSCTFACPEPVHFQNAEVATHLYSIVQEAAHNAVRHGKAEEIEIRLEEKDGLMVLKIQDNGAGIDIAKAAAAPGTGLRIMRYRASLINGVFNVERLEEGGTLVTCTIRKENST